MGLQQKTDLLLKMLLEDFKVKDKDIRCLTGAPFSKPDKDDPDYDPIDYLPGPSDSKNERYVYEGLNKDEVFKGCSFEDMSIFENLLFVLEKDKGFIEYSDEDLDVSELEAMENLISANNIIGNGHKKFIRLTYTGYLEADKASSPHSMLTKYFYFVDKTFYIKTVGGEMESWCISAPTKYDLLLALTTLLNNKGKIIDGWASCDFSQSELFSTLRKINPKIPLQLEEWTKNTKGNFIKSIPENIKGLMALSNFNRTSQAYNFKIKLSI